MQSISQRVCLRAIRNTNLITRKKVWSTNTYLESLAHQWQLKPRMWTAINKEEAKD